MLVVDCRVGETLEIGDSVTITMMEIRGGQVRVGIDAPQEVKILREEIYGRNDEPQHRGRDQ